MAANLCSISTEDGRQLEYVEAGPADGPVILFHPGTPNAATLFSQITEPASAFGLRIISYSRPGYASSTPQPGRRVADAVSDVQALLDVLGVAEFRTLGWSGGGPHALACAALLPQRCRAAAILAGVAPYPAHGIEFLAGMDQDNVEEFSAAIAGQAELEAYLAPQAGPLQAITGDSVVQGMAGLLSGPDQAALTGEFADEMAAALRRSVQSGLAGWRDDDLAFVRDWGFRPADISVPVAIWQGRQDRMVPFAHGQWLAAEIPGAEAHLFADEGHLSLVTQFDKIIADLTTLG